MAKHYSPSLRGFFDDDVHKTLPADSILISNEEREQLLAGQAKGHAIEIGHDGKPAARPPATPPIADRRAAAVASVKREAGRRILLVASLEQQSNDNALIALAAIAAAPSSGYPTAMVDRAAVDAALGRRRAIDALRDRSGEIETSIAGMNANQLAGFRASAENHWEINNAS